MATSASPLYSYYNPGSTANPVGFQNTGDPAKAAKANRVYTAGQGDAFIGSDEQLANQYGAQQAATQNYLNPTESTLATGGGGYTADQASQIELTPEQKQAIVTNAGISAGQGNAAAVGGAERATAAAGGNPEALSTYRARAAQSQAANAGQASTGAEVAAQQAGSAGAQSVGNARLAQQNQGLQYYGNLQSQQGSQGQNEQGLAQGAYGTETSGMGNAVSNQVSAAGVPTTSDKIIGGLAGAASAFLEDGAYKGAGMDAVVAEDGPEAIVKAASDPVRSNATFMANGGYSPDDPADSAAPPPAPPAPGGQPAWLQQYLANAGKIQQQPQPQPGQSGWNKATPYQQIGNAIGKGVGKYFGQQQQGSTTPSSGTFAPGSGQMPPAGAPSNTPYTMPGGLVNRTGASIDGTPSVGAAPDAPFGYSSPDDPGVLADGKVPDYMAGGRTMEPGFHWPREARPTAPHVPQGGYQPLGYRAKPMLADGNIPQAPSFDPSAIQTPMQAQSAMQPQSGKPQIITKPTLIHLEKDDAVVPLSYRPKAKVRPSMAMAAMQNHGYRARPHA